MKRLILFCLIVFFAFPVNAQSRKPINQEQLNLDLTKAENVKRTGLVLTVIGGVAAVSGTVLYWKIYDNYGNREPPSGKVKAYAYTMLGGLGLTAAGIPLWIIGGAKTRHIEAELVRFNGSASVNGIGFKIKF
jgi:hypothetical protein